MPTFETLLIFTAAALGLSVVFRYFPAAYGVVKLIGAVLCMAFVPVLHAGPNVTLVGDDYRGVVMREVAADERSEIRRGGDVYELAVKSAGVTMRSLVPGGSSIAMADLLHVTDIALIVIDSTRGATPVIREHILIARQARVPMLAMLMTNVERLHAGAPDEAAELLVVEVQEIRELLSSYDLNGGSVDVYYDARMPEGMVTAAGFGIRETLRVLSRAVSRRVRPEELPSVSELWGAVYLLTDLEADGNAVTLSPQDKITVWSEGTRSRATLNSISQYHPGDFREMSLSLEEPLSGMEGSRILLLSGERVVGLGAITQIGH